MKAIIRISKDLQYFFVLKSRNGQVVATGETYKKKQSILKLLHRHFASFKIIDLTK